MKLKSAFVLLAAAALIFAGCSHSGGGSKKSLNGVSITPSATSIAATGSTTLTAVPELTNLTEDDIDYTWKLTTNSNYASLSSTTGKTVTFTGKNTKNTETKVKVRVTATYGSTELQSEAVTITLAAVDAVTLSSIAITTKPTTLTYTVGDTFSTDGMVVTATYSDGNTEEIKLEDLECSSPDMTTAGTKTVTVSYTESGVTKTDTFEITVNAEASKLTDVSLAVDKTTIDAEGTATFTATPTFSGDDVDVTYSWAISKSDGTTATSSTYATLASSITKTATLTGKSTDTAATHTVTVTVTVSDGTNTKTASETVTISKATSTGSGEDGNTSGTTAISLSTADSTEDLSISYDVETNGSYTFTASSSKTYTSYKWYVNSVEQTSSTTSTCTTTLTTGTSYKILVIATDSNGRNHTAERDLTL